MFSCLVVFFQAEDGKRYAHELLEFRRVLFRSRVPTAGVPATRTTSKDQTPMTTAVRRKNVYRFKTRPYAHQKEALRQLISNGYGGALLMEPRTGKTKTTIDYMSMLHIDRTSTRLNSSH